MDPKDRAQYPRKVRLTTSERRAKNEREAEREIHNHFINYLRRHKKVFGFYHDEFGRRRTGRPGDPDFTVFCKIVIGGKLKVCACLIEFKVPGGRLTETQIHRFDELDAAGIDVFVCTSHKDAIEQVLEYFELPGDLPDDNQ
jgi:hypothetical protein